MFRHLIYHCVITLDGELYETVEAESAHMKLLNWVMDNPNRIRFPLAFSKQEAQPATAQLHLTVYPNPSIHTERRCMILSIQFAMVRSTSMRFAASILSGVNPNSLHTFNPDALLLRNQGRRSFSLVKPSQQIRELPMGHFVIHLRAKCIKKNHFYRIEVML